MNNGTRYVTFIGGPRDLCRMRLDTPSSYIQIPLPLDVATFHGVDSAAPVRGFQEFTYVLRRVSDEHWIGVPR